MRWRQVMNSAWPEQPLRIAARRKLTVE